MNIVVNEELRAYIDPLTPEEHEALEKSLLAEGCRDALVLWGNVLVDGHNRHGICTRHGLPFQTVQSTLFKSLEDVHLWMIDEHLGRRSLSDFQRGVLALRKRNIVAERRAHAVATSGHPTADTDTTASDDVPWHESAGTAPVRSEPPLKSREDIARAARLSSGQVVLIEKIQKQATPELVAAVKAGNISINAAAAVASLPVSEQVAAVSAGHNELKQAAKRVRDARRKPREEPGLPPDTAPAPQVSGLQQQVAALQAENQALRHQVAVLQAQLEQLAASNSQGF